MRRSTLYPFFVAFILLIVVIVLNQNSFNRMRTYTTSVDRSRKIITAFEELSNHLKSAQIYTPSLAQNISDNYYHLLGEEGKTITNDLFYLQQLAATNAKQKERVTLLAGLIEPQIDVLMNKNIEEIIRSGEVWRLSRLYEIHSLINQGIAYERGLLRTRQANLEKSTNNTRFLILLFSGIAIMLIIYTFISNLFLGQKRKWLEGFLESVLNTSQNGIITYKAIHEGGKITAFQIEFANKAMEKFLGVKAEDLIGKKLKETAFETEEQTLLKKYIRVVETGEKEEFEMMRKNNGERMWFFVALAKMEDGLTATFHNITKIKKYEEELKDNIEQLENSNKELEQYAYIASHDLQEPLRKIRTYSSHLQEHARESLDEKGRADLDRILNSAERMSKLITDILNFSSLKREHAFVDTNLNEVVQSVVQDLDLLIVQKGAVVQYNTLPVIKAIPLQMHQLFYNLINNALKFTKETGQPVISIQARMLAKEEVRKNKNLSKDIPYVELVVRDNGIGFNQQYAQQIFGMFKRLNGKQSFQGSGIGLAICRKVVLNHNGDIYAEGTENEGAAFYIVLPVEQAPQD